MEDVPPQGQPAVGSPEYTPGGDLLDLDQIDVGGWDHLFEWVEHQAPPQWGYQHPEPGDVYMTAHLPTTADIMARIGGLQIQQEQ
jgi:hypothetical protein